MKSNRDGEFEKNVYQLIHLLRKIMTSHPDQEQMGKLKSIFKGEGINVNFCFFNFFPVSDEELDDLEEMYDQLVADEDKKGSELTAELNEEDIDFLGKHGIKF